MFQSDYLLKSISNLCSSRSVKLIVKAVACTFHPTSFRVYDSRDTRGKKLKKIQYYSYACALSFLIIKVTFSLYSHKYNIK